MENNLNSGDGKEAERHRLFTEGNLYKAIITLSIPIILGNLLQTMYQLTDAFWVGRLGADAVASVSISFPILFLIFSLSGGIGLAGAVLISQHKGRKEHEKVDHVSGQTFLMAFVVSFIFSIIGYILTPQLIRLFGTEPAVFNNAVSYLKISFLGMIFVFGYAIYQSLSRAVGEAKIPVYIVLGTVLLNFLLDPLFIYGWNFIPALGVGGAAMATLFTQMIALTIGLFILFRGKTGIHLKLKNFKPDFKLIKKIIILGIPISLEQSSRSIGFIFISGLAASFGTIVLASYGVGMQMIGLIIIPALSLAIANSTLIGHNIGAGKVERAEKIAKKSMFLGFVVLTFVGILFLIFASSLVNIFITAKDVEVIKEGSFFLKIVALSFGFIGIQMAILGTLRGAGNAKTTLYLSSSVVAVQVISAYILSNLLHSQNGIWFAFPIANIFGALTALIIFYRGKWKDKKLLENPKIKERIEEECGLADVESEI